jgi:hypothetical protein
VLDEVEDLHPECARRSSGYCADRVRPAAEPPEANSDDSIGST